MLNVNKAPMPHSRPSDVIEVFLVEDHGYFRQGLQELLEVHDETIKVVGDADSAEDALAGIPDVHPDIVLMDLHLGDMSGIEAIRQLTFKAPLVKVLVLSGSAEDSDVLEAILAGARGYLLKNAPIAEIVAGIRTAVQQGSVLSPTVATQLLDHIRSNVVAEAVEPVAPLTPRELEVLRLMAAGLENAQIAERLVISPSTAQNHVASILAKLQMENRIQAAVYAVKHGLA